MTEVAANRFKSLEAELEKVIELENSHPDGPFVSLRIENAADEIIERRLKESDPELLDLMLSLPTSTYESARKLSERFFIMETLNSKSIEMYTTLPMGERPFNLCMRRLENKGYVVPIYFRIYKKKPHIGPAHLNNAIVDEPINYTLTSEGKTYLSKVRSEQQSKSLTSRTNSQKVLDRVILGGFIDSYWRASIELSNYRLSGSQENLKNAEFYLKNAQDIIAAAGINAIFSIDKDSGRLVYSIIPQAKADDPARIA